MARGFHVIPASENPTSSEPGIAMQEDESGVVLGIQLCDDCIFDCRNPGQPSGCQGFAGGSCEGSPEVRPLQVTAVVNMGGGTNCGGGTCEANLTQYPDNPACGTFHDCGVGNERCNACGCGSGATVLDVDVADACHWGIQISGGSRPDCCFLGAPYQVDFKLGGVGAVTATGFVKVSDLSIVDFETTDPIPNCANFTVNLQRVSGPCTGSMTVNG